MGLGITGAGVNSILKWLMVAPDPPKEIRKPTNISPNFPTSMMPLPCAPRRLTLMNSRAWRRGILLAVRGDDCQTSIHFAVSSGQKEEFYLILRGYFRNRCEKSQASL
jgi:hypothetical protein